jgi:SagB-type dehydrogenase family enzyme
VAYWQDGQLVFENYATGRRVSADPVACTILSVFDDWIPAQALAECLPGHDPDALRRAVNTLERATLLERRDRPQPRAAALDAWKSWNPAAGFLHFTTRDLRYLEHESDVRQIGRKAKAAPPPPAVKRLPPSVPRVALPAPRVDGEFPGVLLARRTWRRFAPRAIAVEDLATVLSLTFRVQGWMDTGPQGLAPLTTSPSGGARHPLEAYVLVRQVAGLAPGLYHYEADRHLLARLRRGVSPQQIARYLPSQSWFGTAAVLVLITAVFQRTQWRYDSARAYRVVLAEAGHVCQTLLLTATWLGLAPFCTMALADSRIEADLGVDGVAEGILYAAGFGARPLRTIRSQIPRRVKRRARGTPGR